MNFTKNLFQVPAYSLLLVIPVFLVFPAFEWFLAKESKGIKIFTRAKKDSQLKEFKAVTEVNASLEVAVQYLKDVDNYVNWFDGVTETELLKQVGNDEFYVYINNSAPWPVRDRDNITHMKFVQEDASTVRAYVTGMPDYIPKHHKRVRVPYIKGFWQFKKITDSRTEVTQQMHAAPGGAIPDWLANMAVVDNPYNTLRALKQHFE